MKKISHTLALLALVAFFSAPSFATAQACPSPCISGLGSLSGQCFGPDGVSACTAVSSGGSGVNQEWAEYYRDTIVWAVNSVLVPILMAIAFIVFLWGVFNYFIRGAADEKSRTDGKKFVMWGIIGFVIISSLWGVVNTLRRRVWIRMSSALLTAR